MSWIPVELRLAVIKRAESRCEYCCLSQAGQEATFHIDHIFPESAGGQTSLENLALACVSCSLRKGAKTTMRDPETDEAIPVFHPRVQKWSDHYEWQGAVVLGRTLLGQRMIEMLDLNRPLIVAIREEEMLRGRHPPIS